MTFTKDYKGTIEQRFWTKVKRCEDNECWEWVGGVNKSGYGTIRSGTSSIYVHRYSWIIRNGSIPKDMLVCHHCDNPRCCNPRHLFVGTDADNALDKARKGRSVGQPGEQNKRSKLKHHQVIEIRDLLSSGSTCAILAKKYNVCPATIWLIAKGKHWASTTQQRRE